MAIIMLHLLSNVSSQFQNSYLHVGLNASSNKPNTCPIINTYFVETCSIKYSFLLYKKVCFLWTLEYLETTLDLV